MTFSQFILALWLFFTVVYFMARPSGMHIKNLLDADVFEKQAFLDSFDYVLADCDGVIWLLTTPLKGAATAIDTLQKNGKKVIFVSNSSVRNDTQYELAFAKANISVTADDILYPSKTAIYYLKQNNFTGLIYVIGSMSIKTQISSAGYEIVEEEDGEVIIDPHEMLKIANDKKPVKAVYIDTDFNLSYLKLLRIIQYLKNPECLFLIGPSDFQIPITSHFNIIGTGPFQQILEEFTNRQAILTGKPGELIKHVLVERYAIEDTSRVLFIGDSLAQDIGFGKLCGFKTLLVLTGSTTKNRFAGHTKQSELPNFYLDSLGDIVTVYDEINQDGNL